MLFTATPAPGRAAWFLRLATSGYARGDGSAAFFPLYPLAVRLVASLPGIGPLGAALIVSNAAFLGALIMLHALTRLELGAAAARRSRAVRRVLPDGVLPAGPVHGTRSSSLLSIAAFWFARRNRWIWAMVARGRCGGDHAASVRCCIVALAVEALVQWRNGRLLLHGWAPRSGSALRTPRVSGLVGRSGSGDFWAPLDAQRNWQREATFPLTALWRAVKLSWLYQTWWLIDVIVVGIAIAGILVAAFRVPLTYTVYAGMSVLIPLTFTYEQRPLTSMPRFMAVVFPAWWGFAIAAGARRPPRRPSWSPSRPASRCSPTCSSTGSPSSGRGLLVFP